LSFQIKGSLPSQEDQFIDFPLLVSFFIGLRGLEDSENTSEDVEADRIQFFVGFSVKTSEREEPREGMKALLVVFSHGTPNKYFP